MRAAREKLPVPRPIAAFYMREGLRYRAAILMERIEGVRSLADRALVAGRGAPWEETGRLIARFHRAGWTMPTSTRTTSCSMATAMAG